MRLPLNGRSVAYDLIGPETAPTVCITHSLASDGGSWAEQVPPLLQAGFRVLRIDMRGHGGSDPVAGDYTMADLAGDVAAVLDGLSIPRVHYIGLSIGGMLGQAFALAHQDKLISVMWCDTLPASPLGAKAVWDERMGIVRNANSLEPIGDATMDRWFTPAFKAKNPKRWQQIRDTIVTTTPAGYLGCSAAILDFDFTPRLGSVRVPALVVAVPTTPAPRRRKTGSSPAWCPAAAMRKSPACGISPMSKRPTPSTASCSAGSRRRRS
jgi:3-oxoadipate enol-lactonase